MAELFKRESFRSHSGIILPWKIECDALETEDWIWAAARVAERFSFHACKGVPRGGLPFAKALSAHCDEGSPNVLICDDVLTTGGSIESTRNHLLLKGGTSPIIGVVLFARAVPPDWVHAIWRLWD